MSGIFPISLEKWLDFQVAKVLIARRPIAVSLLESAIFDGESVVPKNHRNMTSWGWRMSFMVTPLKQWLEEIPLALSALLVTICRRWCNFQVRLAISKTEWELLVASHRSFFRWDIWMILDVFWGGSWKIPKALTAGQSTDDSTFITEPWVQKIEISAGETTIEPTGFRGGLGGSLRGVNVRKAFRYWNQIIWCLMM